MLTGKELYADLPPAVATLRITSALPEQASRVRSTVPVELAMVVQKAMSRAREDRYATAAEIASDTAVSAFPKARS